MISTFDRLTIGQSLERMSALGRKYTAIALVVGVGAAGITGGCKGERSVTEVTPALPVVYDKDALDAMVNYRADKPIHPYYLAQPSGPFTKEEIYGLCAYIGFMVTGAVLARRKDEPSPRVMLEVFPWNKDFKNVAQRNPKLSAQVLDYANATFGRAAALSSREAKGRMSEFPAGREFVEFNRSNIMSCYGTLGSWN